MHIKVYGVQTEPGWSRNSFGVCVYVCVFAEGSVSNTMQSHHSQAVWRHSVPILCCCPGTVVFCVGGGGGGWQSGNAAINQHWRDQSLADPHRVTCLGEHIYERFFSLTFSKGNKSSPWIYSIARSHVALRIWPGLTSGVGSDSLLEWSDTLLAWNIPFLTAALSC